MRNDRQQRRLNLGYRLKNGQVGTLQRKHDEGENKYVVGARCFSVTERPLPSKYSPSCVQQVRETRLSQEHDPHRLSHHPLMRRAE